MTAEPTPSAEFREPRYQQGDPGWGRQPNTRLVAVLPGLALRSGLAWDLGCGHGGDALWLASLGWHGTATDVSRTAVRRVAAAAAELELRDRVTAEQHDLSRTLPEGTFHLVYACYFHSPVQIDRDRILRNAAARARSGGCFVLIDHGSAAPWSWRPDGREPEFPTPADTLAGLGLGPGWQTRLCERAERNATGPDGQTATVADNIIVLRRL
jgi:SAM-dependent methyltransferase